MTLFTQEGNFMYGKLETVTYSTEFKSIIKNYFRL